MRHVLLALALGACASAPSADVPSAAPIIAAERAFAADAAERGWAAAFRRAAAEDAITLSPDPVSTHEMLARIEGDGETTLDWRPAFAGISRSGDFGFTTGPFMLRGRDGIVGHYFTVWRRQRDGTWKWIFDAGTDVADPGPAVAADAVIPTLPVSTVGPITAAAAIAEIERIETFADRARADPVITLSRSLAQDARVNRPGRAAAVGADAARVLFVEDGGAFRSLRRDASEAGDIVFAMGEVRDQHEGAERLRYYARIWQRRPEGWRIVFDEIVQRRGP